MKITLKAQATCGKLLLEAGDYFVTLDAGANQMKLVGKTKEVKIPAVQRRKDAKTRSVQVSFYSGGGRSWSLVVATPKQGEWIALIEYSK